MARREMHGNSYLFKLQRSKGVEKLIAELVSRDDRMSWREMGGGDVACTLHLQGWIKERRLVVLRSKVVVKPKKLEEMDYWGEQLSVPELVLDDSIAHKREHAVVATTWDENEVLPIVQMHHARRDAVDMLDELKNHWSWAGLSTQDQKRSQLMMKIVTLIFRWSSLFTSIATRNSS